MGQDRELLGSKRHATEPRLPVLHPLELRGQPAHRPVDARPGVDAADALQDQVGRADVELDRFLRVTAQLEPVVSLRPLEGAVDDLLRVLDHALDEILGRERPLLDEHRPQPLARHHRLARVGELAQGDAPASEHQLAQPLVAARGRREDHPPVLHHDALAGPGRRERQDPCPATLVESLDQAREVLLGQAPLGLHAGVGSPPVPARGSSSAAAMRACTSATRRSRSA